MVSFPPCKINLGLRILRRRSDGYHDIDTCFYPIPFTDALEVIPSVTTEFTSSGIPIPGNSHDNLCMKAYAVLKEKYDLPAARIHLHKIIPAGAGLGGGSSDAAHTLRLCNSVFKLNLTSDRLSYYASLIGSDCSFFISDSPMIGSGRGEVLKRSAVDLKGKYLLLLNPGIHVSTGSAYAGVIPMVPDHSVESILAQPVSEWRSLLVNDFELSVFSKHPAIRSLKEQLYQMGAFYASMSGSGSSVFGIFDNAVEPPYGSELEQYTIWKGFL